jgi:predicted DNA-binding transcriptional regulator AlpA
MEKLLTPVELSQLIGLAVQSIYNRKSEGLSLPPAVKLGRLLRFPESGVRAWLATLPSARTVSTLSVPKRRPGRPTKAEQVAARNQPQK